MNPRRRACCLAGPAAMATLSTLVGSLSPARAQASSEDDRQSDLNADSVQAQRVLRFPRDHGAHPGARIEWWYATGWLSAAPADLPMAKLPREQLIGFQVTFFRSRTGLAESLPGRLAPRQLLFAHAAVTDVGNRRHRHAQRIGRWSGLMDPPNTLARSTTTAALDDLRVQLAAWHLERRSTAAPSEAFAARVAAPESGFALDLDLAATQPLLLQGSAGYSRKGPPPHASHYVTHPQLEAQASLSLDGRTQRLRGRAWFDHEWSNTLMPPGAVGWDWMGINLADGSALTAFVLRAADGRPVWAGGSHRPIQGVVRAFEPDQVVFTPLRHWTSAASGATYPVRWRVATPVGSFELDAVLDNQELDSRGSTGSVYWEGLSELLDLHGQRVGLGYLEMTGRAGALRLG